MTFRNSISFIVVHVECREHLHTVIMPATRTKFPTSSDYSLAGEAIVQKTLKRFHSYPRHHTWRCLLQIVAKGFRRIRSNKTQRGLFDLGSLESVFGLDNTKV